MITQKTTVSFKDKINDYSKLSTVSWGRRNDQPGQTPGEATIIINSDHTFQEIQGMGAAFSEIGGKSLQMLDEAERETVLRNLFDEEQGAGFTNCRLPVGSSDFGLSAYSLNDNAGDYEMTQFSLDRDRELLIPFIKGAQKYTKDLKIHASPWSPPAWLKDNNDFVWGGSLVDDEKTYRAYASYLTKFIKGYHEEGININKLLLQNEQDSASKFPTCIMEPKQMLKFTSEYLRPEFKASEVEAEICAGTFRTITGFQARECFELEGSQDVFDGAGFQYSLPEHIHDFTRAYPGVKVMHTETPCYQGENTWEQAICLFNHFIDYMNVGCEVFSYWNMILDEKSESTWGWKQNSLVTIMDSKEVIYNPDYHIMEMLSKNIRPGAHRIECMCMLKQTIAFKNPDGSTALFVCNLNDQDVEAVVNLDGEEMRFTMEGSSIMAVKLFI